MVSVCRMLYLKSFIFLLFTSISNTPPHFKDSVNTVKDKQFSLKQTLQNVLNKFQKYKILSPVFVRFPIGE